MAAMVMHARIQSVRQVRVGVIALRIHRNPTLMTNTLARKSLKFEQQKVTVCNKRNFDQYKYLTTGGPCKFVVYPCSKTQGSAVLVGDTPQKMKTLDTADRANGLFKCFRWLPGLLMLTLTSAAIGQTAGSGIASTPHDPRIWSFFSVEQQICVMCHAPHNAGTVGPLWNHQMSVASYTLYASPTMNATVGAPGGVSKLCLSCHDGTIAITAYGGYDPGAAYAMGAPTSLGIDLSNDHPTGITYNSTLASNDGALADPATTSVTVGGVKQKTGSIAAVMLSAGKVECSSCHDVHNKYTVTYKGLLKVSMTGSALCMVCHQK
jgi:predicted CXXCH cytochrome family protein